MSYRLGLSLALLASLASVALAGGTLTNGTSTVAISDFGTIYDGAGGGGVGFARADGYDPILPGTPRDSWSLFTSGGVAYADPEDYGNNNIDSSSYAGGVVTSSLFGGGYSLTQRFSLIAPNVLSISTSLTNNTGSVQSGLSFRRNVDWDVDPTAFNELIDVPALSGNVIDSSYYGFEDPSNPAFGFTGSGTFGPNDLGGGITISLGSLGIGATTRFNFVYAINQAGQSVDDLKAQLAGLGVNYAIVGYSSDPANTNSAALGVSSVPGPAAMMAFGLGLVGRRRRSKR